MFYVQKMQQKVIRNILKRLFDPNTKRSQTIVELIELSKNKLKGSLNTK